MSEVFAQAIYDGLKAKGFSPTEVASSPDTQLKIQIRTIDYSTSTDFWTGGVDTKAAIKAIATNAGAVYENLYRSSNEERVVVVPGADHNAELINEVVSDVLAQMFGDQALMGSLAMT